MTKEIDIPLLEKEKKGENVKAFRDAILAFHGKWHIFINKGENYPRGKFVKSTKKLLW